MAVKIFNATETEYTGTATADLIIGNNLGNVIDAGEGNNLVFGGGGDDVLLAGSGNDLISGGGGNDLIDGGAGNNVLSGDAGNDIISALEGNDFIDGGSGDDQIFAGDGNNVIFGGSGNDYLNAGLGYNNISGGDGDDIIDANEGDDVLSGGNGVDLISGRSSEGDETVVGDLFLVSSDDTLAGSEGNDTFKIGLEFAGVTTIIGGTSEEDNAGEEARYTDLEADDETGILLGFDNTTGEFVEITNLAQALESATDVRLNLVTRPGSAALSTFATTIAGYNAVDTLEFTQSGDFSESLEFSGIERVELKSGVNITLSAEQVIENGDSLDRGFINPGVHFYGVAGGPKESVTVVIDDYVETHLPQPQPLLVLHLRPIHLLISS